MLRLRIYYFFTLALFPLLLAAGFALARGGPAGAPGVARPVLALLGPDLEIPVQPGKALKVRGENAGVTMEGAPRLVFRGGSEIEFAGRVIHPEALEVLLADRELVIGAVHQKGDVELDVENTRISANEEEVALTGLELRGLLPARGLSDVKSVRLEAVRGSYRVLDLPVVEKRDAPQKRGSAAPSGPGTPAPAGTDFLLKARSGRMAHSRISFRLALNGPVFTCGNLTLTSETLNYGSRERRARLSGNVLLLDAGSQRSFERGVIDLERGVFEGDKGFERKLVP